MSNSLVAYDFEVFGKVQGVFFRKHTEKYANRLNISGWCKNTKAGTVKGYIEGTEPNIKNMMYWLEKTGSPKSRIDTAVFSDPNYRKIRMFPEFEIRK